MTKHNLRAAINHRNHIIDTLRKLTDDQLAELDRKGRYTTTPDGFPNQTMGDGTSRGTNPLTGVERAAQTRIYHQPDTDNTGDAIRDIFHTLRTMADTATRLARKNAYVQHVADKAEGRISTLQGECQACERVVSGSEHDRLRSGYCDSCRKAWERAGRPDRYGWEIERRRTLVGTPENAL